MTRDEEEAIVERAIYCASSSESVNWRTAIRLAIQEATTIERERCAKVCEEIEQSPGCPADDLSFEIATMECAAAIRRGK